MLPHVDLGHKVGPSSAIPSKASYYNDYCTVCRFMVSVCYSKAKVAAACAGIVYFLSYVPYMYVAIREEAAGDRISAAVKSLVVSIRASLL